MVVVIIHGELVAKRARVLLTMGGLRCTSDDKRASKRMDEWPRRQGMTVSGAKETRKKGKQTTKDWFGDWRRKRKKG